VPQRRYASPDEIGGAAVFLDGGFAAAGYLPDLVQGARCGL
jgi:hypothetical protein